MSPWLFKINFDPTIFFALAALARVAVALRILSACHSLKVVSSYYENIVVFFATFNFHHNSSCNILREMLIDCLRHLSTTRVEYLVIHIGGVLRNLVIQLRDLARCYFFVGDSIENLIFKLASE